MDDRIGLIDEYLCTGSQPHLFPFFDLLDS